MADMTFLAPLNAVLFIVIHRGSAFGRERLKIGTCSLHVDIIQSNLIHSFCFLRHLRNVFIQDLASYECR